MAQLFANNAFGVLANAVNGAATTLVLVSEQGAKFPSPTGGDYFMVTLIGLDANGAESSWEIVKCSARSTDQLTVLRAQEGTVATSWNAGTRIELRWTKAGADNKSNIDHVHSKADIGLGNVDNTSDANKPISTATQTALNLKANLASPSFTGNVVAESSAASLGISALLGGNYGYESRARGTAGTAGAATIAFQRPENYAVHFGLDTDNKLKVGGWSMGENAYAIYHENNKPTKADVGLANVDNTSDANKPVSTATQTALDTKASSVTAYLNVSEATTASAFSRYRLTASVNLTLPASPSDGAWVDVVNHSGTKTARVLRNEQNINNLAEDMTLDLLWVPIRFVFRTGYGWFIA